MEITRLDVFMARNALEKIKNGRDADKARTARLILEDKNLFFDFVKASIEKRNRDERDMKVSA